MNTPLAKPFLPAMRIKSTAYFHVIWQVLAKHYSLFFPNQENNASAWEELSQKVFTHLNSQTSNKIITLLDTTYTALESVLKDLPLPEGLTVNTVIDQKPLPSFSMPNLPEREFTPNEIIYIKYVEKIFSEAETK